MSPEEEKSFRPAIRVSLARQGCELVIGRVADDETQILFKIIESANASPNKNSIAALLSLPGTREYQRLLPSSNGEWTQAQSIQIQEGVQLMREVIQRAIGSVPTN